MHRKKYSIIIPAPIQRDDLPAVTSLNAIGLNPSEMEILVEIGTNPPAQRNRAIKRASGEIFVFFDSDCVIDPSYFEILNSFSENKSEHVIGGPVLLKEPSSYWEQIAQMIFSNPFVTGPSAARYAQRGQRRISNERELILCNLAVKRGVFEHVGIFDERIYPNEENEWMDRASTKSSQVIYDPGLKVFRAQRNSIGAILKTFFRYGVGRGVQSVLSNQIDWIRFLPLSMVILVIVSSITNWRVSIALVTLIFLFHFMGIVFERRRLRITILTSIISTLAVGAYGIGELFGLVRGKFFTAHENYQDLRPV